jgi:hypothetical protein
MKKQYAELEIGLRWQRPLNGFDVTLHYSNPSKEDDARELGEQLLRVDCERLRGLAEAGDEQGYREALSGSLFGLSEVDSFYRQACAVIERSTAPDGAPVPLHLRLLVDPRAPARFHALRWETLLDPRDGSVIAKKQSVLFSRYLSGADWRPIPLRARHELNALIVVANPSGLNRYDPGGVPLAEVDVAGELRRATEAFGESRVTTLAKRGEAQLDKIIETLVADRHDVLYDVLYIVCHGALVNGQPRLYLDGPDGTVDPTDGSELVERLRDLRKRPTLVVLSACQSAGQGDEASSRDEGALAALGPRLAQAGIAAVVAMQGNVTMRTVAAFMPPFFRSLQREGVVDQAMATARQAVRDRPDWWAPVLFNRLRSGRVWYVPEFKEGPGVWNTLLQRIELKRCTPILGPGLAEKILGSRQDIAKRWANHWQIPMASRNREDLAKVSQYLTVYHDLQFPSLELTRYAQRLFTRRYADKLPARVLQQSSLGGIINEAGRLHRQINRDDPYRILATLPFPLYVTTSWTSLLEEALLDAEPQRKPVVGSFAWNQPVDIGAAGPLTDEPGAQGLLAEEPRADEPFVYRLFGDIDEPESLVITEDNHYAWLESWTANRATIVPPQVRARLVSTTLLFLGFGLDDTDFRVLFHGIKALKGSDRLHTFSHVGVQLNPDSQFIEPEAAQEYLESYFGPDNVSIYWGSTDKFLAELERRWIQEQER